MMKKAKVFLCSLLVLCAVFFCMTALAAEDIVFTFENDASLAGWSTSYLRYNFDPGCFFGYAFEKSANLSDPMFISPILDINAEDYRYVVVNMRFSIDAAWSRTGTVFFLVPDGTWNGNMAVGSERYANGTLASPTNVVFDMDKNKDWKGTIKQIRLDPFEAPGTIELYSITLTNTRPADDSAKDAQANTPKKEIGVFLTPNTYADNFSDVPETEWYASEIESAYELGFVNGKADTLFAPEDGMTIAEAITLAARTNNAYGSGDYGFTAADGEEWYMPYVKYAVENKIIDPQDYTDYNASATRGQMAKIFANALPASEYAAVNSVGRIPDVAQSSPYYAAVLKLFNAGIVMGNDAYGTFYPESGIKRCEAAAIINRIAFKDKRIKKNLLTTVPALNNDAFTMSSEAKCFIDDKVFRHQHMDGVPGGWDAVRVLTAPEKFSRASYVLVDNSDQYEAYYTRKFMPVSDGVLDLDFGVNIYGNNGAYLLFADENGKPVMEILLDHGNYTVLSPDGSYTDTGAVYTSNAVYFDIRVNLDNKTFDFGLDGNYIGTYPLANDNAIAALHCGITKAGTLTIAPQYACLYHNYLLYERFVNAPASTLPYDVALLADGGRVSKENLYTERSGGGTVALNSNAAGKTGIASHFEKASGTVVFESYILLPNEINGAEIALTSGDSTVFSLVTRDGSFLAPDGSVVTYVTENLWTIVRFEADTVTGKVLVKINGKPVGTYAFAAAAAFLDGYRFSFAPRTEAVMYVDTISAFIKLPYPEDYVPEPKIPESDYFIGINVCPLWREGTHYGWEEITAYPEITPVLGYYDEGSPEVSDWEIKMMAEHGIDYEIFCWYPNGNDTKPIQSTAMNQAIIDGYFNARYSDKLKFAIMWENSSVNGLSFEDFKKYTVPYWMEYFFKDERYVKIDNKPLLTVWQLDNKFKDVSAKEAFDYVREECRKAGFDGCEILLYSSNTDPSYEASMKASGIDGLIAYHWGTDGSKADVQAKKLTAYSALSYTVPTISVGFDYVGWGMSKQRNGLLDPKDYPTMTEIVKKALAERQKTGGKYANMVNISTWNEYGEGTYVMPTERFGFGYLDAIRAAFTKTGTAIHSDVKLSDAQRQRINYLFGQDRQLLRPQMLAEKQQTDEENKTFTVDISGSELALIKEPDRTNGGLMVPVYPESGIFSRMMCTYTWNKRTQTLTVSNAKHTVSFVIGKDTMTVDGSEKKLYAATYWYDGLPVLPLDTLAASLGYFPVTHEDGSGVSIMLGSASDYDILKKRKPYQYEFELLGDTEDWTPQNSTISVEGGVLKGISTGNDPAVISPGLSVKAETYPTIAIRMKWDRNNTDKKDLAVIYFRKANAGLSEFRTVAIKDLPTSSNGEFVEFKFNMQEHLQWDGEITGIRFDPFNATGTFEIDYIRFEKAEGAEEAEKAAAEREANLDDTIANGDASMQMYNPMYSVNANVTIVKALNGDPCYNVKANGAGKVWTYCIQKVKFTPGATYRVEFDARMTGTSTGEFTAGLETGIFVNFMYDGSDKRDHPQNIGVLRMSDKDEWQHFSAELTVEKSCDNVNDEFSVFTNPIGNAGVNYQLDNITMTRIDE